MRTQNKSHKLSKELLYKLSSIIASHLTHSEISSFFSQENYNYICPSGNKTDRVYNTLATQINRSKDFTKPLTHFFA